MATAIKKTDINIKKAAFARCKEINAFKLQVSQLHIDFGNNFDFNDVDADLINSSDLQRNIKNIEKAINIDIEHLSKVIKEHWWYLQTNRDSDHSANIHCIEYFITNLCDVKKEISELPNICDKNDIQLLFDHFKKLNTLELDVAKEHILFSISFNFNDVDDDLLTTNDFREIGNGEIKAVYKDIEHLKKAITNHWWNLQCVVLDDKKSINDEKSINDLRSYVLCLDNIKKEMPDIDTAV